jgi:hypothetical protein
MEGLLVVLPTTVLFFVTSFISFGWVRSMASLPNCPVPFLPTVYGFGAAWSVMFCSLVCLWTILIAFVTRGIQGLQRLHWLMWSMPIVVVPISLYEASRFYTAGSMQFSPVSEFAVVALNFIPAFHLMLERALRVPRVDA